MIQEKVVLCFGDSNTWGRNPVDMSRYNQTQRWTRLLQRSLGENFYIVEEGLGGRTTDCENTIGEGRNGLLYFKPCVESHQPDIIILMLGTNDLKDVINKSSNDIVASLEKYFDHIETLDKKPEIILVSPTGLNMDAPKFIHPDKFSQVSVRGALELPNKIEQLAKKYSCKYINASDIAVIGEDGLHWTEESHRLFALAFTEKFIETEGK